MNWYLKSEAKKSDHNPNIPLLVYSRAADAKAIAEWDCCGDKITLDLYHYSPLTFSFEDITHYIPLSLLPHSNDYFPWMSHMFHPHRSGDIIIHNVHDNTWHIGSIIDLSTNNAPYSNYGPKLPMSYSTLVNHHTKWCYIDDIPNPPYTPIAIHHDALQSTEQTPAIPKGETPPPHSPPPSPPSTLEQVSEGFLLVNDPEIKDTEEYTVDDVWLE